MTLAVTPHSSASARTFPQTLARLFRRKSRRALGRKGLVDATSPAFFARTYMVSPGQPVWMERDYVRFAQDAYIRNVIAYRCVSMIATAAASVKMKLFSVAPDDTGMLLRAHPVLNLFDQPNPTQARASFMEAIYHYRLISGNAFILALPVRGQPQEMHVLRPDRVTIIAGNNGIPSAYRYTIGGEVQDFPIDPISWRSQMLHLKQFHPLNDWYGLSPVEAVAYSIDQHNQAGAWNQALMQNGARPSGALVVRGEDGKSGTLSEDQYYRLKQQIDEQFSGPSNSGRPLLLEGGLDWKELSLSPKDMDFIQCKNASARDIALGFGVPPQLLGIPGDNTYSNLQEARLALWEQAVLPLVESTLASFSRWLEGITGQAHLQLKPDLSDIPVLALRNQNVWDRMEQASFLTADEKRAAVGYGPLNSPASTSLWPSARKDFDPMDDSGDDEGDGDDFGDSSGFDDDTSGDNAGTYDLMDDAGTVDDQFNDALAPEDFGQLPEYKDMLGDVVGTTPGGVGYSQKIQNDIALRDWSPKQIDYAKEYGGNIDAINKATGGSATRYEHPDLGKSVVIDNTSNNVIQVGKENFEHGVASGDAPGAEMRPSTHVTPDAIVPSEDPLPIDDAFPDFLLPE